MNECLIKYAEDAFRFVLLSSYDERDDDFQDGLFYFWKTVLTRTAHRGTLNDMIDRNSV